jgi:hypothetical protein
MTRIQNMLRIHQIIGIYLGGYTLQRRYGLQIRFKRNVDRVLGAGLQYIPIHDDTSIYILITHTFKYSHLYLR